MEETQEQQNKPKETSAISKNKKWIIIGIVVIVVIVLARMIFSPANVAERMLEQATGGNYDVNVDHDGSMQITGGDGEKMNITTGKSATLPDNWPNSLPVSPDAKIEYSGSVSDGEGGTSLTVTYSTSRSAAEITEFYKEQLSSKGWNIEATIATGDGSMLSASDDSDGAVVVYIGESDGMTTVNITTQVPQ